MPGDLGVDVVEHGLDAVLALLGKDAELLGFLLRSTDRRVAFRGHGCVTLFIPFTERDEVRLQPLDRVAERPQLGFVGRAIAGRIVRRGVSFRAIGEELDECRTRIRSCTFRRPFDRGIDGERVITVDAKARDSVTDRSLCEGRAFCPGNAREARDGPLVVHDREDDGNVVNGRERQGAVEVAFGRRAVADPAHRDAAVALDSRAHRPADSLRELRAEIARYGEEAVRLVRIHDRKLAALQLVAFVRIDLVHHLDERIAARDEQALLAIGREVHVVAVERVLRSDGDCLFAGALHVEAGLTLALRPVHAVVEDAHGDHVAQHLAQRFSVELRVPRADRLVDPHPGPAPAAS